MKERDNDIQSKETNEQKPIFEGIIGQQLNVQVVTGDIVYTEADAAICFVNRQLVPLGESSTRLMKAGGSELTESLNEVVKANFGTGLPATITTPAGTLEVVNTLVYAVVDETSMCEQNELKHSLTQALKVASETASSVTIPFPDIDHAENQTWSIAQACAESVLDYQKESSTSDLKVLTRVKFVCNSLLQADVLNTVCRKLIGSHHDNIQQLIVSTPDTPQTITDGPMVINAPTDQNANNYTNTWHTVKEVLRRRRHKGRMQYLVRWAETDGTDWVDRRDLSDAALQHFVATRKRRKRKRY